MAPPPRARAGLGDALGLAACFTSATGCEGLLTASGRSTSGAVLSAGISERACAALAFPVAPGSGRYRSPRQAPSAEVRLDPGLTHISRAIGSPVSEWDLDTSGADVNLLPIRPKAGSTWREMAADLGRSYCRGLRGAGIGPAACSGKVDHFTRLGSDDHQSSAELYR